MPEENVLLIYPPFQWGVKERFSQPLGILILANALKQAGIKVTALDITGEGWLPQKIADYISKGNFTHVGVTTITPFKELAYRILKETKKVDPTITTIVGGPHPTYLKEKIFSESKYIDVAISGEAELDLADIIRNPTEKFYDVSFVKNVDESPIPDRTHVRHIQYNELAGIWMDDTASMMWARGCPWRKCRFCSRNELTLHYRQRSPEKIIEEIAIIQNELKYKNILVVDDSLKFSSKYIKKILRSKIKEGLDIPFWALARADHIDEEGARLMKRAGCSGIQVGLESVVPRIIDMYKKTSTDPKLWRRKLDSAFELCNKNDIIVIASFILGAPTETREEIQSTVDYCRTSKLDIAQTFPFQFVVGSEMWMEAIEEGYIKSNQFYTYNDKQFGTTEYTTKELFEFALDAENQINSPIYNPGRYIRLVRKFIKQKKWSVIAHNITRIPTILKNLLLEHPYENIPEDLYA
ncbi:MAG TPA: radical SAM protein [candidate division Zixibacteria bacterium]|nr:radical SAM protein [candidate division Zixibacteria bacterium]